MKELQAYKINASNLNFELKAKMKIIAKGEELKKVLKNKLMQLENKMQDVRKATSNNAWMESEKPDR